MRGAASQEFTGINEHFDARQQLSALMAGELLSIEGIENLLDEPICHFGGEVGFGDGVAQ